MGDASILSEVQRDALDDIVQKIYQLPEQSKNLLDGKTLSSAALNYDFYLFENVPYNIRAWKDWIKHSQTPGLKGIEHLQEAVEWWEREDRELAQLVVSLQSNLDAIGSDLETLQLIYTQADSEELNDQMLQIIYANFQPWTIKINNIAVRTRGH
ncbi:hypothetical protein CONLIGDRAFT_685618 [Coniochaeta ligniaria NRRL 30616]|uniref:Uncharacterized protein n=1 Tax=Coniochaeta ligniaria NRRL 30616 TaxID=1408157 RepID=A0A1J7JAS1_9PEZI|nr:hypothetical protein CONLIGDRAFT_685618 [Coniochaeta ligniaria NRRL 30616]